MCHKRLNPCPLFCMIAPYIGNVHGRTERGPGAADEVGMALPGLGRGTLLAGVLLARYAGPAKAVARATAATSSWAQHLASPLGLFLLQLLVLLLVARARGRCSASGAAGGDRRMAAGLMMGPLVLGSLLPQLQCAVPASSLGPLGMLSQLGVLMFLLVAGAELDLAALRGRRRFAFTVSHAGIAVPFVLGVAWPSGCIRSMAHRVASRHSHCSSAFR